MSVGLPSDEVAEDYKNSLEDLVINSRYEISNLTVIAKENTEHAMAISRVLENHIRTTPPDRKLPAMYVLDSIVKNIGTPYTLFLGRNLYNTFMNTYTLVNSQVRKKLDEMLKTWKEPVPGSLDTKPVFPPDVTRPIENALIKARTAAVQQQQQQQFRSQQEMMGQARHVPTPNGTWRNTPTPPQANGPYRPPAQGFGPQNFSGQGFGLQGMPNGQAQPQYQHPQYPQQQQPPPRPVPTPYQQPYPHPGQPAASHPQYPNYIQDLQVLHRDIDELIRKTRDEFAANIHDTSIQTRLKALLDLQGLMQQQQLPPHEIQMIRDQVNALSPPALIPQNNVQSHYNATPPHVQQPFQQPLPQHQAPSQQPPTQHKPPQAIDLQALLSSSNLAAIISKAQRATPTPPQTHASLVLPTVPVPVSAGPPPHQANAAASGPGLDLMASLRAVGLIPSDSSTPVNGALSLGTPPPQISSTKPVIDVQLTSASLKISRPLVLSLLFEALPNQCSTCGRRFLTTNEGRDKKARHLDWHFRTNQRLVESTKRGQSRSWYVDELDWIKSRDDPEDISANSETPASGALAVNGKTVSVDPKSRYVPVPSDQTLANLPCPICQEKFDTIWNEEAQDFVWMDAIKVAGRIYHASCHSEMKKDGGNTPLGAGRTSTPDSVLGKRKAEG